MIAGSAADLLASAAEEIICLLDAEGLIPVWVRVRPTAGALVLLLGLADEMPSR